MSIAVDHSRAKEIENWICNNSIAKTGSRYEGFQWKFRGKLLREVGNTMETCKLEYPCDTVFLVDIDLLHYNFENRRIRIYIEERKQEKLENKSKFASLTVAESNKEDIDWLEGLLLGKREIIGVVSNASGFEQELIANGQQEPAVITRDGTLRNGNRRKAIFHDIIRKIRDKENGYEHLDPNAFKYLKVVVLPHDIRPDELFDLENFLQTKRDWKQPYDAISTMMIIKEAVEKLGLSFEDIKTRYLHDRSVTDIEVDYKKIIAIDKYLTAIERPGQYRTIQNQQEMFEDYVKYDFSNSGLAALHKERLAEKQAIGRKRDEFFYDMVSANHCNNQVLKPSEKAVRRIVTEIFKNGSEKPETIISRFYSGVDAKKLSQCEETNVYKFATNIESQIGSFEVLNADKAPLDKLKRIALDLNRFSPKARESLARKRETGRYVKLAKEGLSKIESDVAKHQKKG